jgi:NADPH:quinone reductase-like Zn-dependent oxidoreductase
MDGTFPTLFLLFQEGKIPPLVQEIYPLEQYREALDGIAGRGAMGKIVLVP